MEPALPHLGLACCLLREALPGVPRWGSPPSLPVPPYSQGAHLLQSFRFTLTFNVLVLGHRRVLVFIDTLIVTGLL